MSLLLTFVMGAVTGCGGSGSDDPHTLMNGIYEKIVLAIDKDDCGISMPVGSTDRNYGTLTATDAQVTHTDQHTFTNEIYMRSGNKLTRMPASSDFPAPGAGMCIITDTINDSGSITANNVVEILRHETHVIKSGDCTGILHTMCESTFRFQVSPLQ